MAYELTLTKEERDSLLWIAARYTCADVLVKGADEHHTHECIATNDRSPTEVCTCDGGTRYVIPEHIAWEYRDELASENGSGCIVPPCAGGTLAKKLLAFSDSIV